MASTSTRTLGLAAAACLTVALWGRSIAVPGAQAPGVPAPMAAHATTADMGRYIGSDKCQRCHEDQYASWHRTLHVMMTKPIAEATVVGDFRPGARLDQNGRSYRMETANGKYYISVSTNGEPPRRFEVHYTLGVRRFQGYMTTLPDGRIYVLPAFWHNLNKRWVDWKEITPIPEDPQHDLRQIWNVTCVNCHATNLVKNYSVATNSYKTTWTEMGIGCEACHGPGEGHVALEEQWEKDPASKPTFDDSEHNRDLSRILRTFSPRTASARQVYDACGYCHGNKNNAFFDFRPGDRYEDFATPFLISQPIPANDPQGDFWPDGRPSRFNRPQAMTMAGCFEQGNATCTTCHTSHGPRTEHLLKIPTDVEGQATSKTRQSDTLCTQCHALAGQAATATLPAATETTGHGRPVAAPSRIPDLEAHTHHKADSPGSRCVACHMADVNWRLFTRRLDHTFQPPVPEMTAAYGMPNPCTTCHEDKSPEWAASVMDRWYSNGERRRGVMTMAAAFYKAGTGDTSVLPDLARLAVDRTRGALVRASAAEFAAQLLQALPATAPVPAGVTNGLIGAAADPEPVVRVMAVRALAFVRETRVAPIVSAHLTDPIRTVRTAAAESMLHLGMARLDGPAGRALAAAQDEWAESLRTFPDESADHTTLGWLLSERGEAEPATRELEAALKLDPKDARAHMYLGVLAARLGQFDSAIQHWKQARTIAPAYTNLDRLIEEAQKRLQKGS